MASTAKSADDPGIVNALDAPFELPDVPLRTTAYAFESASSSSVKVVLTTDVDIREFDFRERDGRFEDAMAYVIEVRDRKTAQRYRYDQKVEMSLQPKTREQLSQTWYFVSRDFLLPAGAYKARVVIRDLNGGRLGSVTHDFEVPRASEFRISTPILSDLVEAESTPTSPRPVLIARRTFLMGTILYCQYLVYGAERDSSTNLPRVTAGYALRRATGHIFKTAPSTVITPTSSGAVRRLHGISLQGAAPGQYELVLTVHDEVANRTASVREPLAIVAE
jgi:hypothetical protein